jgi:hypothetical protein
MELKELNNEQYLETMDTSMRFIEIDDQSYGPFPLADYVEKLIQKLDLPTSLNDIEIHYIYMNDKKDYCHILFNWGRKNVYVVVITKPSIKQVYGFHFLDLNAEYGLYDGKPA